MELSQAKVDRGSPVNASSLLSSMGFQDTSSLPASLPFSPRLPSLLSPPPFPSLPASLSLFPRLPFPLSPPPFPSLPSFSGSFTISSSPQSQRAEMLDLFIRPHFFTSSRSLSSEYHPNSHNYTCRQDLTSELPPLNS